MCLMSEAKEMMGHPSTLFYRLLMHMYPGRIFNKSLSIRVKC